MNEHDRELQIQRCVDGELPEAAQHELLSQLDQSPEGWKELALAFVEQQVWSQACSEDRPVAAAGKPAAPPVSRRTSGGFSAASFRWTAAAGLLVALGVGFSTGQWFGRRPSEELLLTHSDRPAGTAPVANRSVTAPPKASVGRAAPVAPRNLPSTRALPVSTRPSLMGPDTLELPVSGIGEPLQSLQIPVYQPSTMPDPGQPRPSLTEAQERRLEQLGYRLDRKRQLISIPLEDGTHVVVPVETLGVKYGIQ